MNNLIESIREDSLYTIELEPFENLYTIIL